MRASSTLLLVAALLGGAAFYFLNLRGEQSPNLEGARRDASAAPDATSSLDLDGAVTADLAGPEATEAEGRTRAAGRATERPVAPSFGAEDGPLRTVTVRVDWPDAARPVDEVDVYLFDDSFSGAALLGTLGSSVDGPHVRTLMETLNAEFGLVRRTRADIERDLVAVKPVVQGPDGWYAVFDVPEHLGRIYAHAYGSTYLTAAAAAIAPADDGARLTPQRGARLVIEVATPEGSSPEGALFTVKQDQSLAAASAQAGSESIQQFTIRGTVAPSGRVALDTVPTGVPLEIRIEHPDFAVKSAAVDALLPGMNGTERIDLTRGLELRGSCVDAEGQAVRRPPSPPACPARPLDSTTSWSPPPPPMRAGASCSRACRTAS